MTVNRPLLDAETLYETHAARLYAYCWALAGDDAPAALRDTFAAAALRPGPGGDLVLWLHSLAREVCERRGAFSRAPSRAQATGRGAGTRAGTRAGAGARAGTKAGARAGTKAGAGAGGGGGGGGGGADLMLRAAATLRADHREVLVLSGGQWLDPGDIGRLLGLDDDAVHRLTRAARTGLEQSVLDLLMRSARHRAEPGAYEEVIKAFEEGRLDTLLARRVPGPPAELRLSAVAALTAGSSRPASAAKPPLAAGDPAIRSRAPMTASHARRRRHGAAWTFGLAASVAAAIGLATVWPGAGADDAVVSGLASLAPAPTESAVIRPPAAGDDGAPPARRSSPASTPTKSATATRSAQAPLAASGTPPAAALRKPKQRPGRPSGVVPPGTTRQSDRAVPPVAISRARPPAGAASRARPPAGAARRAAAPPVRTTAAKPPAAPRKRPPASVHSTPAKPAPEPAPASAPAAQSPNSTP